MRKAQIWGWSVKPGGQFPLPPPQRIWELSGSVQERVAQLHQCVSGMTTHLVWGS